MEFDAAVEAQDEPVVETTAEGLESGADATQVAEGGDPGQAVEGQQPEGGTQAGANAWPVIDGKTLSPAAKQTLEEIRQKDPNLAKHLRSALFQADAIRRELPGGLKEVQQLRQTIEDLGGDTGIQTLRADLKEYEDLDKVFTNGDPSFFQMVTKTPEGKDAFIQLAPHAVEMFQQLNPEGYSSYFAQVFLNHLYQQGVTLDFQRLGDFLQGNEQAAAIWKRMGGYFSGLSEMAKKPFAPERKEQAAQPEQEQQLAQREQALIQKEWTSARNETYRTIFEPELKRLTEGRKISDQQRAAIVELFGARFRSALQKLPQHADKVDRYFSARDQEGYNKYFKSVYSAEIPKALRAAVDVILPTAKKAAPATPAAAAPSAPAKGAQPAAGSGYQWVAQMPKLQDVDRSRTTPDMIREGRAVLNGGKKVQWKKL